MCNTFLMKHLPARLPWTTRTHEDGSQHGQQWSSTQVSKELDAALAPLPLSSKKKVVCAVHGAVVDALSAAQLPKTAWRRRFHRNGIVFEGKTDPIVHRA